MERPDRPPEEMNQQQRTALTSAPPDAAAASPEKLSKYEAKVEQYKANKARLLRQRAAALAANERTRAARYETSIKNTNREIAKYEAKVAQLKEQLA